MKTNKILIINPTKDQAATATMLSYLSTLQSLVSAVIRDQRESFEPRRVTDAEVRKFIQRVEYVGTAVTRHSGKEFSSLKEAMQIFSDLGKTLYGDKWTAKLLKSEIFSAKEITFGINVSSPEMIKAVSDELEGLAEVVVNGGGKTTSASNELVIETKAAKKKREAKEANEKQADSQSPTAKDNTQEERES